MATRTELKYPTLHDTVLRFFVSRPGSTIADLASYMEAVEVRNNPSRRTAYRMVNRLIASGELDPSLVGRYR